MSEHLAKPPFVVLQSTKGENDRIKLTEGPYKGIIFSYGGVRLEEIDDTLKIHFNYDVHDADGVSYVQSELEEHLGELLQLILVDQLMRNEVVYTGGIDETRTTDSEQTDL
jgi:hypothetical protein